MRSLNYKKEEYPFNLLMDVFGDEPCMVMFPDDLEIALEFVLWRLAKDYERSVKILLMRYREHKSFDQIAAVIGATRERVRQIVAEMLRKLRHPSRLDYIRFGMTEMLVKREQNGYEKGYKDGFLDGQRDAKGENVHELTVPRANIPLEDMDFSVRSYNCLKRAGVKSITDIAKMDFNQLIRVRNLGRKSMDEIIMKMREYGYDTSAMEQPQEV